MKKLLLGILLASASLFALASTAEQEQAKTIEVEGDSISLDYLVGMDKKKFKGKSVKEFLNSAEAKGYQDVSLRYTPEGVLGGLKVKYTNKLYLNVYLDESGLANLSTKNDKIDLTLLEKVLVEEIRVVYVMYQEY